MSDRIGGAVGQSCCRLYDARASEKTRPTFLFLVEKSVFIILKGILFALREKYDNSNKIYSRIWSLDNCYMNWFSNFVRKWTCANFFSFFFFFIDNVHVNFNTLSFIISYRHDICNIFNLLFFSYILQKYFSFIYVSLIVKLSGGGCSSWFSLQFLSRFYRPEISRSENKHQQETINSSAHLTSAFNERPGDKSSKFKSGTEVKPWKRASVNFIGVFFAFKFYTLIHRGKFYQPRRIV